MEHAAHAKCVPDLVLHAVGQLIGEVSMPCAGCLAL